MLLYSDQIKQTIYRMKPVLTDKYHVRSIKLFDSVVRDDFKEKFSNIDWYRRCFRKQDCA
jgi:predicted nucleotidyltransferase